MRPNGVNMGKSLPGGSPRYRYSGFAAIWFPLQQAVSKYATHFASHTGSVYESVRSQTILDRQVSGPEQYCSKVNGCRDWQSTKDEERIQSRKETEVAGMSVTVKEQLRRFRLWLHKN